MKRTSQDQVKHEGKLGCTRCQMLRDPAHMVGRRVCIFCRADLALRHLSHIEGLINFTPVNSSYKIPCKRCKVLNWFVNLNKRSYCHTCAEELIAIEEELLKEPILRPDSDLDDILEDLVANMEI